MTDETTDEQRLTAAFASWTDAQRAALDAMLQATDVPRTTEDLAEGYRWVTRLTSLAQDWFVEKADPLHPQLFVSQDEYRKLLVDNPDVRYRFSVLDDSQTYRITGTRGDAAYVGLSFGTAFGKGEANGRTGTLTQVHLDQFELGPDGEVDLLVIPPGAPEAARAGFPVANQIELVPGTAQVAVRETFFDKRTERPAELRIELVGDVPPPRCEPADLADKLGFAALFVQFVAATAVNMWHDTAGGVNTFGGTAGAEHVESQEDEVRTHVDADMTYHGGRWVLDEGEGLEITVQPPADDFLYWGLTITNPWMESYDYRYATTCLNNRRAVPEADGSWKLVISPTDPGVANWIDTGGRLQGYMLVRWVLADRPPHPTAAVRPIADLASDL